MGFFGGLATSVRSMWPDWFSRDRALKLFAEETSFGASNVSGQPVTINTAMTYSAVWSAVSVISQSIASFPCPTYRRMPDGRRERIDTAPTAWLLNEEPNPEQTPFVFFETAMHHVLVTGNFYAEIVRDRSNKPVALWLLDPSTVEPYYDEQQRLRYRQNGGTVYEPKDIVHVPGLGYDGVRGYSVIRKAALSIGLGIAAEKFGGTFYGNGAWPGIMLEHPQRLGKEAQDRLKDSWKDAHQGADRAHRLVVLEEGMKLQKLTIPPDDAQFLETRQFQVEEIARWFNLPLTKLKSKAGERPGGNIEAQNIEFVVDCLRPWLVRIEQEFNRKLIVSSQRSTVYVEFNVDALLRGDSKSRAEAYKLYLEMGVLSAAQIADKENLPEPEAKEAPVSTKVENLGQLIRAGFEPADSLKVLGLPPIKHTGQTPVTVKEDEPEPKPLAPAEPAKDEEKEAARAGLRVLIVDGMNRLIRVQCNEARRGVRWEEFREKQRPRLMELVVPAFRVAWPMAPESETKAALLVDAMLDVHGEQYKAGDVALLTARWERDVPGEVADAVLGGK